MSVELTRDPDHRLRRQAEAQLNRRQDFAIGLAAYLAVSVLLVAIWSFAGGGEFWPLVPIVVWGIGVAIHGFSVYRSGQRARDPIATEIERLRARAAGR